MSPEIMHAVMARFRSRLTFGLGAYTFLWGCWLINPWWEVFSRAPLYDALKDYLPEWAWGLNALLAGTTICLSAICKSRVGFAWGMGASLYHWGGITCAFLALLAYLIHKDVSEHGFEDA